MIKTNILIIDTSGKDIRLGLSDNNLSNVIIKNIPTEKQSLDLPISVADLLSENNAEFANLLAVAIVVGPGSFTGVRLAIAYAKGLSIGLNIPVISINAFEIYLEKSPYAFVAIDTGRGDCFVGAANILPCTMAIDEIEVRQMNYAKTVGHKPYDLSDAFPIIARKIKSGFGEPVIPLYLRASYAELNFKC